VRNSLDEVVAYLKSLKQALKKADFSLFVRSSDGKVGVDNKR
jgi:hypothetical protein